MPRITTCRECGAGIIFKFTDGGKRMPLDAEPTVEGNVRIGPDDVARVVGPAGMIPVDEEDDGTRYMPHHATCPFADKFRKKVARRR